MMPEDFPKPAGNVKQVKNGLYYTFQPHKLPVEVSLNNELLHLSHRAVSRLSTLGGRGESMDNPHLLITPYMRREALSSSKIEGTRTTLEEVYMEEAAQTGDRGDNREVLNYVRTLEKGISLDEITVENLKELHRILLENGVRGAEKNPGEFKHKENFTGGTEPMGARFVFSHPETVEELIENLLGYILQNDNSDLPPIFKIALTHYQFETIHPFRDGNGRIGRVLIILYLLQKQVISQPLIYLSSYFERHREEYEQRLYRVSTHSDYEGWINFFMKAVIHQANDALERTAKLTELRSLYKQRILEKTNSNHAARLVDFLFRTPIFRVPTAQEYLDAEYSPTKYAIEKLMKLDIVERVNPSTQRGKLFRASEIVNILQL